MTWQNKGEKSYKVTRLKLVATRLSALLGVIGDLIIPSAGTGFLIPGVVASYINIVTLTTKTSSADHPATHLCCHTSHYYSANELRHARAAVLGGSLIGSPFGQAPL
jgi:hypothetical protein